MGVDILFLNNKEMTELGAEDMVAALHDVEQTYILTHQGDVLVPGKCVMRFGTKPEDELTLGRINAMPGYVGGEYDVAGIKWIGSGPDNYKKGLPRASTVVILNDPDTKLPICIADGTQVSAKRTGASGGVAIKLLARSDASVVTICGAGAQARTQLEAAMIVRPTLKTVYIYDIRVESSQRFAQEMGEKYPALDIIVVEDPKEACCNSDIIITVTLADKPIVHSDWVKKGCLIVHMAGYEVTYDCVKKADKLVMDNWETIKHRMGSTVALMAAEGLVKDEDIHAQLGEILVGEKTGRENDDEIIYFNAVGTGILDMAIISRCYRKALAEGKGTKVPYWV